ncbi:TPA: hypothetical protein ACH3X1_015199 [Trebouxia sp. C0004]
MQASPPELTPPLMQTVAHAAAADQQQLSVLVVHDSQDSATLSEHAQTEPCNGKGDASQGAAVIKACTKTDQPSWNELSKDRGQGLQNGGHKVPLAAQAGQLDIHLMCKPQDGAARVHAAQEQPALDSAAERDSHAKPGHDSSTGSFTRRVKSWLHRRMEACKGLVNSPIKRCSSKALRVK